MAKYRAKRDFARTAEPRGKIGGPGRRLRFVVQKHQARNLHYDLRLEWNGVFRSWAVTRGVSLDPADKRLAVAVENHPLDYGDFEGTIPKGQYGGGTVMIWDRGFWQPQGDVAKMLAGGALAFRLVGRKLKGRWALVRMGRRGKAANWLLIKHRDRYARPAHGAAILKLDHSIASGRSMRDIASGRGRKPRPFMRPRKAH